MKNNLLWTALLICLCQFANAQDTPVVSCGQKEVTDRFLRENPIAKRLHDQIELQIADYTRKVKSGQITAQRTNAVVTLPVVVHIIHNNGPENISDATAMAAIQHLNEAFANTGFYDPANGVNTEIQFCLAQRDPSGNATNGITRNVSSYTVMSGSYTSDDQNVKNLNRWNPSCYINIWLVREIPGGVAGYAYLPSAHGSNLDGIVMEAGYFGSSHANDVVIIHEMGHYLGLYHTFEGACNNDDCTTDGDRICDTPPDQSTGWASCNSTVNSCSTDPLSGFATDVNDLKEDYMDYGNFNCMKVFTQGQADRMNWIIQNVRKSLLNCNSCLSPCPAPVTANFTASATTVPYGTTVNFTNSSTNAGGYRWYVNDVLQSTATNFSYTFNAGGTFIIRLVALPTSPLCDSVSIQQAVNVICTAPVTASFTSSANNVLVGTTVNFTNNSVNANSYRWYINGALQSTATNYSYTFNTGGLYVVRLVAMSNSPVCDSMAVQDTIRVNCGVTAGFSPLISTANINQTINFTNSSINATSYQWLVNGIVQGSGTNFSYTFSSSGNFNIRLRAIGATCTDSITGTVVIEDTCSRFTFQKSFGGNSDDMAYDVQPTADGGFVVAGRSSSFGNGRPDGFIAKLDAQGDIQWNKIYGGLSDDWFSAIIKTTDGGYLAVGNSFSFGTGRTEAWVVKTDANGNLQWSRRFNAQTGNGEEAFSVVQTPDGGYVFSGARDAAAGVVNMLLTKLDAAGNMLWNRYYDAGGTDGAMNIIADGNELVIGGFTRTGISYHDALLMKINGSNGDIIWTQQYEVEGLNNRISRIFKTSNGYAAEMHTMPDFSDVTSLRSYRLTIDANGNATDVKRVIAPTYMGGGGSIVPMDNGSFVITHNENTGDPDFNIYKFSGTGNVIWAKKYPRQYAQYNTMLRPTADGGFVSVGYTGNAGNYDIYIVKTDAQGNSPGCDTQPVQVTTQTPSFSTYAGQFTPGTGLTAFEIRPGTLDVTMPLVELCEGTTCEEEPPVGDDTCSLRSSFQKEYGTPLHETSYDLLKTKDGGHLVAGKRDGGNGNTIDGYAIKFNNQGKVEWAKAYGGSNEDMFHKVRQTNDGGYIFGGYTRSYGHAPGEAWIVKTDAAGNLQWSRQYGDRNPNGERIFDIIQTSDGGYAFAGNHKYTPGVVDGMVVRLDASGNVLWSRAYGTGGSDEILGLLEDRDTLVVTAFYQTSTGYDAVLMKLNKNDGEVIWLKSWDFDNRTNRVGQIFFQADGYLIGGVNSDGYDIVNPYQHVIKTDHNGNLVFAKELRTNPVNMNGYMAPTRDGGYVTETFQNVFLTSADIFITKHDKTGNVTWSKQFEHARKQTPGGIVETAAGVILAAATSDWNVHNDVLILKTNSSGTTAGCSSVDIPAQNRDALVNPQNFQWPDLYPIVFNTSQVVNPLVTDLVLDVLDHCQYLPCDTLPDDDSCDARKNFVRTIGGNGNDEAIDIIITPDGGNLLAGTSNSSTGSNVDALIVKTDASGQPIWSKTYGGAGADVFNKIIKTRDGNYLAVGAGSFKVGHASDVFIVKINPLGNIIWAKAYGQGSFYGEVGRAVVETADGGFAIAADFNNNPATVQPLYMKVDMNGVLLWSKLFGVPGTGHAYDVVAQGDVLIGTGVVAKADVYVSMNNGYIIKLDNSDGAVRWTRNIESNGRSNFLHQVKIHGTGLLFAMVNSDNYTEGDSRPVFFRTDTSGNVLLSSTPTFDGLNRQFLTLYSGLIPGGGYVFSATDHQNNSSPKILKFTEGHAYEWIRLYTPFYSQSLGNIVADKSGYTTVGRVTRTAGGNADILLIKTSAAGYIGNDAQSDCMQPGLNATFGFPEVLSTPRGNDFWQGINNANLETINAVPNVISSVLSTEILCIDSSGCELPPDDDTCTNNTFVNTYTTSDSTEHFTNLLETYDDALLVTGATVIPGSTPTNDGVLVKMNKRGTIIWQKRFAEPGSQTLLKAINTSDNNYLILGYNNGSVGEAGGFLLKMDAAGTILWKQEKFTFNPGYAMLKVIEGMDNFFYILGTHDPDGFSGKPTLTKVSNTGITQWSRQYQGPANIYLTTTDFTEDNVGILITGEYYFMDASQQRDGFVLRVTKSTGSVAWAKRYHSNINNGRFNQILTLGDQFIINAPFSASVLKIDFSGNVVNEVALSGGGLNNLNYMALDEANDLVFANATVGTPFATAVYKLDTAWNLKWMRVYPQIAPFTIYGISAKKDIFLYGSTIFNSTKWGGLVARLNSQGLMATCPANTMEVVELDPNYTVADFTIRNNQPVVYTSNVVQLPVAPVAMEVRNSACTGTEPCTMLDITGKDTLCLTADSIVYKGERSIGCQNIIDWTIDPGFADILLTTDSTISLRFKKTGTVTLYGKLLLNCEIISDSIVIFITQTDDTLNLGPDIQLCKISTWPLNAGSGFKTYLWQDGSTDSTFTVTEPGTYHVTVTDFCGNQLRDTVIVSLAPDVPFDLGPDIAICDKDTVTITAPAGFTNYYWSPEYRASNSYNPSIKVYTDRDTTYTVVAEKSPGCLVTDTIRVLVRRPTPLDLGTDTMFCRKDSVLLDAGPAFSSYLWSNNLTTQQIYVTTGGNYHVAATDINGCVSRDTIGVVMNEIPDAYLGPDTLLCRNSAIYFQPRVANALHFYLWQDGSTQPHHYADQPGIYWVEVTSRENCKSRDTVEITGFTEPPSDFLADTIGVCDGEPIELRANGNFVRYRWDNSITTATIMVDRPGIHYLLVTDANGCTGLDSIRVYAKNCVKQIFFPNAFTPNNDGQHDIWKPIVRGRLIKFHLVIYNRWGGKVYETSDASRGWNGMINHLQQSTNTFVWACTYRFIGADEVEHKERGTLTLIR